MFLIIQRPLTKQFSLWFAEHLLATNFVGKAFTGGLNCFHSRQMCYVIHLSFSICDSEAYINNSQMITDHPTKNKIRNMLHLVEVTVWSETWTIREERVRRLNVLEIWLWRGV